MSLRTRASQAFGTRPPRVIANTRVVRNVKVNSSSMSQEEYQEYLKKAMQDPKVGMWHQSQGVQHSSYPKARHVDLDGK